MFHRCHQVDKTASNWKLSLAHSTSQKHIQMRYEEFNKNQVEIRWQPRFNAILVLVGFGPEETTATERDIFKNNNVLATMVSSSTAYLEYIS